MESLSARPIREDVSAAGRGCDVIDKTKLIVYAVCPFLLGPLLNLTLSPHKGLFAGLIFFSHTSLSGFPKFFDPLSRSIFIFALSPQKLRSVARHSQFLIFPAYSSGATDKNVRNLIGDVKSLMSFAVLYFVFPTGSLVR